MRWLKWIAGPLLALVLALTFVISIALSEGALHPFRRRRPAETAGLAYRMAAAAQTRVQSVTLAARDGTKLHAWWLTENLASGEPRPSAVMICHGVGDSAFGALGFAPFFLSYGYAVLVPESRGHGESQGFVSYGVQEAPDIQLWVQWLKARGSTKVFGFGESLGAAILLQSLADGADLKAVVAECSYSSFDDIAEFRMSQWTHSRALTWLLIAEAKLYVRLKYGVDLSRARPEVAVRRSPVPVLLIHGLEDHETPAENSQRIADQNQATIRLWLVPNAVHTGAYAAAPAEFEERVRTLFESR